MGCLEDLITYFAQPEDDLGHEEKQKFLKALRNRQDLFQEEGILNLILDCIDKMNVITSQAINHSNNSELLIDFLIFHYINMTEKPCITGPRLGPGGRGGGRAVERRLGLPL